MRTLLAAGAAALLAATALSACTVQPVNAGTARTSRGPITIWYSNNPQEVEWGKQAVKAWNATHPDQPVTGQEIPTGKSSEAVIQAGIIAGTEPCLIYNTSPASVPSFQQIGGLVPLNQFPGAGQYIQQRTGKQAAQYRSPDGNFYQLPWKSNPVMIFYNKKLFAKAGLDPNHPNLSSYSDFIAAAKKIVSTHAAKYAIYPSPATDFFQSWYDFYPMYIAQSGGTQLIQHGKATFDDATGRDVANFWHELYADNLAGKETYNGDAFADGVAAMSTVGPWAIAVYKKVDWGVVPVPTKDGKPSPYTFSDAKNVGMYASCTHRLTAWDFLKYTTSKAQDGKFLDITGQIPMRTNIQTTYASYFKSHPAYATFAKLAAGVVEVPNVPNSVDIWQAFRNAWEKSVIFGNAGVDSTLAGTAHSVDDILVQK
ncbi:MAG TPA: extracellular solute-binding protein [Jatrophihabitantaceae bacterium]|jgi:multiple sugar transport system substrate-binding protein